MPLRLIELIAPPGALDDLEDWPGERPIIDTWRLDGEEHCSLMMLLDAGHAEEIVDELLDVLGDRESCRMVSLPVEATLPRPEEPERDAQEKSGGGEAETGQDEAPQLVARVSREELYSDLEAGCQATPLFLIQVFLSTVVACVGLLRDDTAVVVGAMVIAPLLAPNMALGFGATLGDLVFVRRALTTGVVGLALAATVSVVAGTMVAVDPEIAAIVARTRAGIGDVVLALATGVAGTLAVTSGLATTLIGVMVAVALLPPLAAAGLLAGSGLWYQATMGALLVLINVVCVNLASVATFAALGIRPQAWWEREGARRTSRAALLVWTVALSLLLAGLLLRAVF